MNEISIIVPVYSIQETYLRRCIESIIHQSFSSLDILLIDDGSPDNCGNICDEYAKQDNRIRVVHQTNQGVSVARNVGINHAKGDWIMFVDADDWLDKKVCEEIFNKANEHKPDILNFGYKIFNENDNFIENKTYGDSRYITFSTPKQKRQLLERVLHVNMSLSPLNLSVPWGKLIKRQFLIEHELIYIPNLVRMQDMIFCLYLYQNAETVHYIDYPGYYYNKNNHSACAKYNSNSVAVFEDVLSNMFNFLEMYYPDYNDRYLCLGIGYLSIMECFRLQVFHDKSRLSFIQQYREVRKILNNPLFHKIIQNTTIGFLKNNRKLYFLIYCKFSFIITTLFRIKIR